MDLIGSLQAKYRNDSDLLLQRTFLANIPITLIGFNSLIDLPQTMLLLQLKVQNAISSNQPIDDLLNGIGNILLHPDESALVAEMVKGQLLLFIEHRGIWVNVTPTAPVLTRAIEAPTTENVMRGSISAFNEDIETNIGIMKKQLNSPQLHTKSYWLGTIQRKRLALLYVEGRVDSKLLHAIVERIESHLEQDVQDLKSLNKVLGFTDWTLVTNYNTTELPENASNALMRGKAVLLLDRFPYALILPSSLWDMFAVENDRNFPIVFMALMRLLRIGGVLGNILMPGLYVALVSVNPDVLRIELALSIAESRAGVPYPAFIETILLLFVLELILEASVRLPKSIGPTITMVGGIILGQAVVAAKLVSNLLIIILAATFIASSTVSGFQNSISIRMFKYVILILSAIYGVLGLLSGLVLICAYVASVTSFGVPYLQLPKPKDESNG
ncbi:spore gernimation protein GerA [Paenibacillus sp. H1-7]|uniref:spore germination protein n=1 Tax=Paenibacillus sp. H1-7 TaxID=2282849 RepID=UPI001EF94D08|nr:spore germination protein [Paenibacillus sp. H1-7]ULL17753.1 spore gernimation protein GerA [Paenibacillus sp. H1-7]